MIYDDDGYTPDPAVPADVLRDEGLPAPSDPYAEVDRERLVELAERGKPYELSPAEVEAADAAGMQLDEYAMMQGAESIADVESGMARLQRDRAAREEAEHQRAVDRARRAA